MSVFPRFWYLCPETWAGIHVSKAVEHVAMAVILYVTFIQSCCISICLPGCKMFCTVYQNESHLYPEMRGLLCECIHLYPVMRGGLHLSVSVDERCAVWVYFRVSRDESEEGCIYLYSVIWGVLCVFIKLFQVLRGGLYLLVPILWWEVWYVSVSTWFPWWEDECIYLYPVMRGGLCLPVSRDKRCAGSTCILWWEVGCIYLYSELRGGLYLPVSCDERRVVSTCIPWREVYWIFLIPVMGGGLYLPVSPDERCAV